MIGNEDACEKVPKIVYLPKIGLYITISPYLVSADKR